MCTEALAKPVKPMSPLVGGAAGLVGGTLSALCGVGGGVVLLPIFKGFGGGMTPQQVAATAMFSLMMGSSIGAATYLSEGVANVPTSMAVFIGSTAFSLVGAKMATMLPGNLLTLLMKPVILLTIPLTLSKTEAFKHLMESLQVHEQVPAGLTKRRPSLKQRVDSHGVSVSECVQSCAEVLEAGPEAVVDAALAFVRKHQEHFAIGAAAGLTTGLIGIGGGLVLMTLLGHNMPQHEAVATGIVALLPSGMLTSLFNLGQGTLVLRAGLIVGAANMAGMYGGVRFVAPYVEEDYMRYLFASLLVVSLLK